jgi:hypothetical protein
MVRVRQYRTNICFDLKGLDEQPKQQKTLVLMIHVRRLISKKLLALEQVGTICICELELVIAPDPDPDPLPLDPDPNPLALHDGTAASPSRQLCSSLQPKGDFVEQS